MQVVFVGDWFQLPPVANIINNDPGRHCFLADVWRDAIKHRVVLTEVMRQKDREPITAVNELERGFPLESTHRFMESLSRPLPPGDKPLTLYGTNFEVDWHNASEISSLPGDVVLYKSTYSGVISKLNRTTAKMVVSLKVNCPVILLRNIGQGLVNGLQGTVTILDEDGPTVQFPACLIKLEKIMFTVVDSCNTVEAEREQFPVAPAFALTVHKAQGLTLPRVIVNCKNIFNPGQLGVAVGRAVESNGLQVVNYTRDSSKRHQGEVYSFYDEPDLPVKDDDISCCDEIPYVAAPSREALDLMDFSDESDYDDNDLQRISDLEFEAEADSRNKAVPAVPALSNQARYTDSEVQDILISFKTNNALTPQQHSINEAIVFLQRSPKKLRFFFEEQHQKLTRLFTECGAGKKVKDDTAFLKRFHAYLLTHDYQKSSCELFSPDSVNRLLLQQIITAIRKDVTAAKESADPLQMALGKSVHMDVTEGEAHVQESGYCKVRYVGGFNVAKLKKKHYMNVVRNSLQALKIKLNVNSKLKVDILQSLTSAHMDIVARSRYPASLAEVSRRQNVRFGLGNISDECFEFFLSLEKKRLPLYGQRYLDQYKADLLTYIHSCVLADTSLFQTFADLFLKFSLDFFPTERKDISCILEDLTIGCSNVTELFTQIVNKYLNATDSEFRRKVLNEMGRMKTLEHRKQVLLKKTSQTQRQSLSWSTLTDDKSKGKVTSHLKLKGSVIQDTKQLAILTKEALIRIGAAYGLALNKSKKKDILMESLSECIQHSDAVLKPAMLDITSEELKESITCPEEETSLHDKAGMASGSKASGKGMRKGKEKERPE